MSGVRTVLALSKALTSWALHGHRDMQEPVRGLHGAWAKVLVPPGPGEGDSGSTKGMPALSGSWEDHVTLQQQGGES